MTAPKLRFKEFDGDWTKVSLDKVSKVFDGTHQTPNYVESGIKFVSVENIHAPYDSDKFITVEAFKKDFKNQPQQNDILMTRITAGEIGATTIVDNREPLAYYVSLALIRPKAVVTTPFLNQYIGTPFFKNELHKRIIHVAFPKKINLGDINECLVSLPDKQEEQTKIASFLSAVDEKISQLTQKHELLSQYKQGMMQKLFSQQIRFKADDGSEFGEWEDKKLAEVCNFINGRAYKQTEWEKEGIPVIRLQNLTGSGKDYYYSNLNLPNHQYCYNNDLLYMWSATFGPVFWQGEKAIFHYHIWKIEVNPQLLDKKYAYFLLDEMTEKMKRSLNGSTMLHVTKQGMEDTVKTIPSLKEQTKIANFLSAIDQKIEVVAQQIEQAKQWKKGLLQQMFV